jgi:hypothetical protein
MAFLMFWKRKSAWLEVLKVVVDGFAVCAAACHASGPGLIPSQTHDLCGKIALYLTLHPGARSLAHQFLL